MMFYEKNSNLNWLVRKREKDDLRERGEGRLRRKLRNLV